MSNTKEIETSAVMALFKVLTANVQDKMISELSVQLGDISVDKLEDESEDDFRMRSFSVLFAMFSTTVLQGGNYVQGAPQSGLFPVGVQRNEINFLSGTRIGYESECTVEVLANLQGGNALGGSASVVFSDGVQTNEINFSSGKSIDYVSNCIDEAAAASEDFVRDFEPQFD